jgi:hypothetical protein
VGFHPSLQLYKPNNLSQLLAAATIGKPGIYHRQGANSVIPFLDSLLFYVGQKGILEKTSGKNKLG